MTRAEIADALGQFAVDPAEGFVPEGKSMSLAINTSSRLVLVRNEANKKTIQYRIRLCCLEHAKQDILRGATIALMIARATGSARVVLANGPEEGREGCT